MEELNRTLFLMINASSHPPATILALATFLAAWLIDGIPALLAGMWLWGTPRNRTAAFTSTASIVFALACNQLISAVWPHPRPFMVGLGHSFLVHTPEASFPSDHATVFFTLGVSLIYASLRKVGAIVLVLGGMVGWARVYLGVHFPFDIVGALWVALGSGWLVGHLLARWQLGKRLLSLLETLYQHAFALPIAKGWVRA
ncbi:MAG: phosphatase PAP2 family protein [Glaciimonas sp.]|nr:phosphatase PAP2 family protein [Glaciimonas sp.]